MKFLSLLTISFLTLPLSAQTSGIIIYEDQTNLHRDISPDNEELKSMIPEFRTTKWELIFYPEESLYQPHKEIELTGPDATNQYRLRFGKENRILYKNLTDEKLVDSRDFMQKQFLIKGFTTSRKWKIGKNQKSILGYQCLEATAQEDSTTMVRAWFAPQINIPNGPSDFQGLPGMILQIDINDGSRTLTAISIDQDPVDRSLIIIPTKGKEITSEEFEKIRKEKMEEMNRRSGSSTPMFMLYRF